jgi:hypothetical protein
MGRTMSVVGCLLVDEAVRASSAAAEMVVSAARGVMGERGESMAARAREGVMGVCAGCSRCVRAVVVVVGVQVSVASDGKQGKTARERASAQILVPGSPRGPSRSQRPAISAGRKPCRVAQSQHSTARFGTKSRSGFIQRERSETRTARKAAVRHGTRE